MKSLRSAEHVRLMELLIEARAKSGLTQEQVATPLDRDQSFVAKYEGGERRLDVVEFMWVARVIGFSGGDMVRQIEAEYTAGKLPPPQRRAMQTSGEEDDSAAPKFLPPGRKPDGS